MLYDCESVVEFCVASSVVFSTMAFKAEYLNEARWGMGKSNTPGFAWSWEELVFWQIAGAGMPSTAGIIEKSIGRSHTACGIRIISMRGPLPVTYPVPFGRSASCFLFGSSPHQFLSANSFLLKTSFSPRAWPIASALCSSDMLRG